MFGRRPPCTRGSRAWPWRQWPHLPPEPCQCGPFSWSGEPRALQGAVPCLPCGAMRHFCIAPQSRQGPLGPGRAPRLARLPPTGAETQATQGNQTQPCPGASVLLNLPARPQALLLQTLKTRHLPSPPVGPGCLPILPASATCHGVWTQLSPGAHGPLSPAGAAVAGLMVTGAGQGATKPPRSRTRRSPQAPGWLEPQMDCVAV